MKPKSKSSSLITLSRRGRQRSAGQARGCAQGGAGAPQRSSPGTVAVIALRGERGREIRTFWQMLLPEIFYCFDLEGEGEDLQESQFKSEEAGECDIGTKQKWFIGSSTWVFRKEANVFD